MNNNIHRTLKYIREHTNTSRSVLMRATKIQKKELNEIIEYLEVNGAINSFKDVKTKRNPTRYQVVSSIVVHNIIEIRCAYCGVILTDSNISETVDKKGYPFCIVCENKTNGVFGTCKYSATYFGTHFAEVALSKVFKNVEHAPYGNKGFDFICNHGKKIDVKAACVGTKKQWEFAINKNTEADYFLLAAFDNRVDLNLLYLWLIPGCVLNSLQRASVGQASTKWDKYKLPVDKARKCCEKVQHDLHTDGWRNPNKLSRMPEWDLKERDIWCVPEIAI